MLIANFYLIVLILYQKIFKPEILDYHHQFDQNMAKKIFMWINSSYFFSVIKDFSPSNLT